MITSLSNSKIKHVCQLVTKAKARRTEQLFVAEGIRMAKEAPKELLKEVYVSTSFLQKKEQSKLLETLSVPYEEVSDDIFTKMSVFENLPPFFLFHRIVKYLRSIFPQRSGT